MTRNLTYADLEIRILGKQNNGYPVEITVNSEQEFPRGYLSDAHVPWVAGASAQADGQRLFEWLFSDASLKTAWAEVRGQQPQRRIRLRLDAASPELHAIPWELLRDITDVTPQDIAATMATPFSRYLAGKWQPGSPILKRPIKILVAVASPDNLSDYDLANIDVEEEWALMSQATEGLDVELTQVPQPCTLSAIEALLKDGHHILHFVGHGSYSQRRDQAQLYLADEENNVNLVSAEDFAAMLARQLADVDAQRDDKLRLVFLASCQTATRSNADAYRGFAPALVSAGVPAVMAMQDLVPVETAQAFSQQFYGQLLQHGQVDLASNEARSTILTANLPGAAIPVLFTRLRSGLLLGQRGRISSANKDTFWPFLLEKVDRGQVIPFLGPQVNTDLLPDSRSIAKRLADKYGFPLADREDLVRVAQFIAISDPDLLRSDYLRLLQRSLFGNLGIKPTPEEKRHFNNASFSATAEELNWAEKVLTIQENEIHHLLADLELPLYITTNTDNFMVEALKHRQLDARQHGLRWQLQAGSPQFVLTPPPSPDQPVVFHLNGFDSDPEQAKHLVLSEDDYLTHFVRLSRDQEAVLPVNLLEALAQHSFLFLGYDLDDWAFRVILQGLLSSIAQTGGGRKIHVGVQLEDRQAPNVEKAMDYLRRNLGRYNIDIYWGSPQQFATELHTHWSEYFNDPIDDW